MEHSNNIPNQEASMLVQNIENTIKNNRFSSKEKLIEYLQEIQKRGVIKDKTKLEALLNLYDNLHPKTNSPLDMSGYEGISTEKEDLIVSKKDDQVLKTTEGISQYQKEFLSTQNTITANNSSTQVNAEEVFEHMAKYQKEELNFMTIEEAISKNNIDIEILNKIKFFITNNNMDINIFKVDITTGVFYNKETNEIYEVRKNNTTNQYEICKGSNQLYNSNESNALITETLENETIEHQIDRHDLNKSKVRVKKLDNPKKIISNAAFTRFGFLIINILSFAFLTAMIILLNK